MESAHFRPWRELAVLAITGMELSWLALWYRIFTQSGLFVSFWRAFAVLGGVCWVVYLLARLLYLFRIRVSVQRGLVGGTLVLCVLVGLKLLYFIDQPLALKDLLFNPVRAFFDRRFSIPAEVMVVLILLCIAWRAISLVHEKVGPAITKSSFFIGILAFSFYGLFAPLTDELPIAPLYLFLFFSLLAMSLARVHVIEYLSRGSRVTFDRKWLMGIMITVLGLLGFAILSVFLMQHGLADGVVLVATWLWKIIFYTGMILMIPLMLLLMAVVPSLSRYLQLPVQQAVEIINQFIYEIQMFAIRLKEAYESVLGRINLGFHINIAWLQPALLGLLFAGLFITIIWSVRAFSGRPGFQSYQETDNISTPGSGTRQGSRGRFPLAGILGMSGFARRRLAEARIRRIYAALLALSRGLGRVRPAGCTPLEFLPDLKILFADHHLELERITQAYLRVRYAETPESIEEIHEIETAWRRIQAVGERRIKEERGKLRKTGS